MWALGLSTVSFPFDESSRSNSMVVRFLAGNSHWSTSVCKDECNRNHECDFDLGTRSTEESFKWVTTIDYLAVSSSEWSCSSSHPIDLQIRLKTKQEDRPATYDEIQASPAMKSLPEGITKEETEMVQKVIANIPIIPDDYWMNRLWSVLVFLLQSICPFLISRILFSSFSLAHFHCNLIEDYFLHE